MKIYVFKFCASTLFTLSFFSALCFGQNKDHSLETKIKSFKNSGKFEVTYDASKNRSNVWAGWVTLRPSKESKKSDSFEFGAAFPFDGRELKTAPEKITLFLKIDAERASGLDGQELIFMIDGKMLNLGAGLAESGLRWIKRKSIITLKTNYLLTPAECRLIGEAQTVEFRLGEASAFLTAEHKEILKNIAALAESSK